MDRILAALVVADTLLRLVVDRRRGRRQGGDDCETARTSVDPCLVVSSLTYTQSQLH